MKTPLSGAAKTPAEQQVMDILADRLHDDGLVERYNFFIWEVVKAHVAASPKHPQTLHYSGDGVFMVSGKIISRWSQFRPEML